MIQSKFRTIGNTLAVAALLAVPGAAPAQSAQGVAARIAPAPFGPGERMTYKVTLSPFGRVGSGSMEIPALDTVRGRPTYHMVFKLKGSTLFGLAKVDDTLQSWVDVSNLVARRFKQDQKEVNFERHRTYEFFPEERRFERENGETGDLPTNEPLDDVSFIYFVRTLPLVVGETYTLDRYFKASGNPVTVKVVRRETVKVPAGTFATVVVQPIIRTEGMFGEGGKAEIFFTDDDRRLLVQLKSNVPVLGSLGLQLESYSPGERLGAKAALPANGGGR